MPSLDPTPKKEGGGITLQLLFCSPPLDGHPTAGTVNGARNYFPNSFTASPNTAVCASISFSVVSGHISAML